MNITQVGKLGVAAAASLATITAMLVPAVAQASASGANPSPAVRHYTGTPGVARSGLADEVGEAAVAFGDVVFLAVPYTAVEQIGRDFGAANCRRCGRKVRTGLCRKAWIFLLPMALQRCAMRVDALVVGAFQSPGRSAAKKFTNRSTSTTAITRFRIPDAHFCISKLRATSEVVNRLAG